mgnify:FL=1
MEPGVIKKQMQKISKKLHSSMTGMPQMTVISKCLEDIKASIEDAHRELRGEPVPKYLSGKPEKEKKNAKSG